MVRGPCLPEVDQHTYGLIMQEHRARYYAQMDHPTLAATAASLEHQLQMYAQTSSAQRQELEVYVQERDSILDQYEKLWVVRFYRWWLKKWGYGNWPYARR